MRLLLICVGRSKAGPEREMAARYIERAANAGRALGFSAIALREVEESRARRPEDRKAEEAKEIRSLIPPGASVVALDETGKSLTSRGFAEFLGRARDESIATAALVIGGADGLDPAFVSTASLVISFGAMTWPHQLVRIMAAEQIYRAITILSGHPYHRD
ncbi:MAG TPA: 23S rRNA (pseudouridine(1915)-N(3))-methyltransferase RlmH [Beijerinckia sp.]|jgi:23S rRNA (pseudouridine1915-N3)-methyltransferase|nr:23S rRNA (pseudouridine(1915)-N(3))-methyltransferase RlmH [Beijerinckia sp.]